MFDPTRVFDDLREASEELDRLVAEQWALATPAPGSNLFVRQRPAEVGRLLELGETLRQAHRTLDAGQLSEASRRSTR